MNESSKMNVFNSSMDRGSVTRGKGKRLSPETHREPQIFLKDNDKEGRFRRKAAEMGDRSIDNAVTRVSVFSLIFLLVWYSSLNGRT